MASDLKIEIFAFKLFQKYWYGSNKIENELDVLEIYRDECAGDNSYLEACDNVFVSGFYQRGYLLTDLYVQNFAIKDIKDFTTLSEVYNYIIRQCDQDELFGDLSVFERMLATSEFVINICYHIYTEISNVKDVLKYSHIFWAMYFDKFTEEFYKQGGWNKLKIVAKSYEPLTDLLEFFHVQCLWGSLKSLKESAVNYFNFKEVLQYLESNKSKRQHKICASLVWVKFRISNFYSYIRIPCDYEKYAGVQEVHLVLEDLRFCCDPSLRGKIYEKEKSQENGEENFLIEKARTFEHSLGMNNELCNEISYRLEFEKQSKSEDLISSSEVASFDIAKNVENIQFDKKFLTEQEMAENSRHIQNRLPDLATHKQIGDSQKLDNFHQGSSLNTLYVSDENKIEEFRSRNVEEQSKIPVITEVFSINRQGEIPVITEVFSINGQGEIPVITEVSINQEGEYECNRESARRSYCNPKDIESLDACSNSEYGMINTKEKPEVHFYSKKGQTKNSKKKNKESINQMTISKYDVKSRSDMLHQPKQLSAVHLSEDTCDEIEKIQKAREHLRGEQSDLDIKNFLRLILVLGDKQGIEAVRLTLRSNEESLIKSHERPNKKKRSKSKKSGM